MLSMPGAVELKAKPLGNYAAICPEGQKSDLQERNGVLLSIDTRTHRNFLIGEILALGSRVPLGVSVGDRVVYERMSAHPAQTAPIDASVFGGESGLDSYLIPVYPGALLSAADLEECLVRHKEEVEKIGQQAEVRGMESIDLEKLEFHERAIQDLVRKRKGRSRNGEHRKKGDTAIGSGVVAIIDKETDDVSK
mgnify:CR=1 FL=1